MLFGELLRLTIFFSPRKSCPPPPDTHFLFCLAPPTLFHSPFCLHRGMNFKHSASHLSAPPLSFFTLLFSQNWTTHSPFPARIQQVVPSLLYPLPETQTHPTCENDTNVAILITRRRQRHSFLVLKLAKCL